MLIPIQLTRDQPLQRQLYQQLRELIVSSRLLPGTRMPSTRMMAERFAISRITVLLTYERMIAEGYLETRPAKGTYVSQPPAASAVAAPSRPDRRRPGQEAECRVGLPDPSLFPATRWRTLMRTALDRLGAQVRLPHPAGNPSLRHAIAHWLSRSRGLAVSPEQIIVFHGRQPALHFAAHLAVRPGGMVVIEDPCDPATAAVLASEGGVLHPVAVGAQGIDVDALPAGPACLLHVTPEHQRQLGVALSIGQRQKLLAWAARAEALVLEEDCCGELRCGDFLGPPPLMSLDKAACVMLLGSFAASLGPWINFTYLVLPDRLVGDALAVRTRRSGAGRRACMSPGWRRRSLAAPARWPRPRGAAGWRPTVFTSAHRRAGRCGSGSAASARTGCTSMWPNWPTPLPPANLWRAGRWRQTDRAGVRQGDRCVWYH